MAYKDKKTGKFISKEEWERQNQDGNNSPWNVFVVIIVVGLTLLYLGGI